ncbi:MAG: PqqD family protein [Acidobacteria bacterium]|nr:PqqD family protein [Acidobacteriota bacterium]MBS1867109.1 PqqD family protein [Acidobacteriota bacterium]
MTTTCVSQAGTFVRNKGVVCRKIEDETLVVPIRGGVGDLNSIYSLNPLGAHIWQLLDTELSLEEITQFVVDEYDVTFEQAQCDISSFLNELISMGLVLPASESFQPGSSRD